MLDSGVWGLAVEFWVAALRLNDKAESIGWHVHPSTFCLVAIVILAVLQVIYLCIALRSRWVSGLWGSWAQGLAGLSTWTWADIVMFNRLSPVWGSLPKRLQSWIRMRRASLASMLSASRNVLTIQRL